MAKTKCEFRQFHDAYGKAYGEKIDRIAAERAWKRLSDHDRRAAIAGIGAYRDYCRSKGIAMKYPSGYLNLHRWEIEEVPEQKGNSSPPPADADALAEMEEW